MGLENLKDAEVGVGTSERAIENAKVKLECLEEIVH